MFKKTDHRKRHNKDAFTLVEVIVATVIIGLAVVALLGGNRAFSQTNGEAVKLSNAEFLIGQMREKMLRIPIIDPEKGTETFGTESGEYFVAEYDDIDDFDGMSFSPPIDVYGNTISDLTAYTQRVTVQNVNADNFNSIVSDHSSDFVRITVEILLNGNVLSTENWIRARQ